MTQTAKARLSRTGPYWLNIAELWNYFEIGSRASERCN